MRAGVAFLFMGESLLIPHLYPIVEALAATPGLPIDLWISTPMHEALLGLWIAVLDNPHVRLRRAPGFRRSSWREGDPAPRLPAKLPMLARLLPRLAATPVVVCAEQTSLWLPTLLPLRTRFVKTSHGVGSMSARDDRRRRSPALTLVPSERERRTYLDRGFDPARIVATGYIKAGFRQRRFARPPFREERPILLYTPHWQARRSSWPLWGARIVDMLARQSHFNVILAPHQRLVERAPEVRDILAAVAGLGHIHCDLDSFAMVDGSYTAAADIYLGDTSSQVVEFLMRPRPCVFLNPWRIAWREDASYDQWRLGDVVDGIDDVLSAIGSAKARHVRYRSAQTIFAQSSLSDTSGTAPRRAAEWILTMLDAPDVAGKPLHP